MADSRRWNFPSKLHIGYSVTILIEQEKEVKKKEQGGVNNGKWSHDNDCPAKPV